MVDAHERYSYRFAGQQVRTVTRGLPCGGYAVSAGGRLIAAIERKSLADLVSSKTSGRLATPSASEIHQAQVITRGDWPSSA